MISSSAPAAPLPASRPSSKATILDLEAAPAHARNMPPYKLLALLIRLRTARFQKAVVSRCLRLPPDATLSAPRQLDVLPASTLALPIPAEKDEERERFRGRGYREKYSRRQPLGIERILLRVRQLERLASPVPRARHFPTMNISTHATQ